MEYSIDLQKIADELEFDLEDVEMILGTVIENAIENLDSMKVAIEKNNLDDIRKFAHAIKGSTSNMLLLEITAVAQKIEENAYEKNNIDYLDECLKLQSMINSLRK